MLKRFLLNMLSSFVGAWFALGLFLLSAFLLIIGLVGNLSMLPNGEIEQIKSGSILKISLDGSIEEREQPMEPDFYALLNGEFDSPQTLDVLVQSIREAAVNDDVKAIYLKCGSLAASPATLNALRKELLDFKKETNGKKRIIAYADSYSQGAYFVASIADELYMNPAGSLDLRGLGSANPYFKGLFDKIGVEFQVVKVGTFKSAVEPYILTEMSDPARAQLDTLFSNMWHYIREQIASSRKNVNAQKIDSLINNDYISIAKSDFAVKSGLIDKLIYERELANIFADRSGRDADDLNFISPRALVSQTPGSDSYSSKDQIAVLFASGEIADGNSSEINYEDLVPVIVELADNDDVKGLVLRVNSPGGSVFGSDQIGEALDYFQSKGKPFAVSMGDYAASGGYWISADADRIFADPLTITGSIGIFGLIPNFKGTLDKIGVNIETVNTNPNANFPTGVAPLNEDQLAAMQKYVDRGYEQFVSRVAKGRKMPVEKVKKIAEGRVWDAQTAVKIGLVDELGGLQEAIEWTAKKAAISDKYDVAAYPIVEPTIWNMIQMQTMSMTLGEFNQAINQRDEQIINAYIIKRLMSRKPIQARMPELKIIL